MKTVLFVDDDLDLLNSIRRVLRALNKDWLILYAESGAQALRIMEQTCVDVVVADMGMPEMNGLELLDVVRERYPRTIRIMMTGQSDFTICQQGMTISQYFLWKPVEPGAVLTLLQLISKQEVTLKARLM